MTKQEKLKTSEMINEYIHNNPNITHIFFLVDIRHKPTNDDRIMYDWLIEQNIPFTIIATKADKVAKTKIDEYLLQITKTLFSKENIIAFSSESKLNVDKIETLIKDNVK